jgi:uncharacterized protein (DUF1501 family)
MKRRDLLGTLTALTLSTALPGSGLARGQEKERLPIVTLDLRGVPLNTVLDVLMPWAKRQYTLEMEVLQPISLKVVDQSFENVFELLLRSYVRPLTYSVENALYVIRERSFDTLAEKEERAREVSLARKEWEFERWRQETREKSLHSSVPIVLRTAGVILNEVNKEWAAVLEVDMSYGKNPVVQTVRRGSTLNLKIAPLISSSMRVSVIDQNGVVLVSQEDKKTEFRIGLAPPLNRIK